MITAEDGMDPMPLWWREQVRTLVRQYTNTVSGNAAWIGIASTDGFWGPPRNGLWRRGGALRRMQGEFLEETFIWQPSGHEDAAELWVAPTSTRYRSLYSRFLQQEWTASLDDLPLDVDHLFPASNAVAVELAYVRLLAIPRSPNRSAGTLEKRMLQRAKESAPVKKTRLATMHAIGKAIGHVGYAGLDLPQRRREIADAIADRLATYGVLEGTSDLDRRLFSDRLTNLL